MFSSLIWIVGILLWIGVEIINLHFSNCTHLYVHERLVNIFDHNQNNNHLIASSKKNKMLQLTDPNEDLKIA